MIRKKYIDKTKKAMNKLCSFEHKDAMTNKKKTTTQSQSGNAPNHL